MPGHAFEALAAGGDQRIEADAAGVDRQRAEARHRVDDQALAVALADLRDLGQWVLDAGAGFAMHQHDVRDRRVGLQSLVDRGGRDRRVFGKRHHGGLAAHHLRQPGRALAVGAVVGHQHMAVLRHQCGHRGLDAEGAAALQWHHHVAVVAVHDVEQALAQARGDGVEIGVPRTPVLQHRELGAQRGGQGSGREQDAVAVHRCLGLVQSISVVSRLVCGGRSTTTAP